jgi:lipid-A-disaccharide synthase
MTGGVYLVAAEPSGDALGADVIAALRAEAPDVALAGVGLDAMARAGVAGPVDMSDLAILGFFEGLKALDRVKAKAVAVAEDIAAQRPDAAVFIDSWGFSLRAARALKSFAPDIARIKLIGPQVWATRPGRAKTLSQTFDLLLCMHAFEQPYYAPHGLETVAIGNPAVGRDAPGDGAAFRRRHGLAANDRVLLVLFGSRRAEIEIVAPVLEAAVRQVRDARPDLKIITVVPPAVRGLVAARRPGWGFDALVIEDESEKPDGFAAADVALACSGTVTTEVGLQGAAVVVAYKIGWITWAILRFGGIYRAPFATLMNVAAGAEIAPEFLQTKCRPDLIAAAVGRRLDEPTVRLQQVEDQNAALAKMGRGGPKPADVAARAILSRIARGSG